MMEQVFDGVGNLCKVGCSLLKRKTRPLGGYLDVGGGVPFQAVSLAGITRPDRVESATKSHPQSWGRRAFDQNKSPERNAR